MQKRNETVMNAFNKSTSAIFPDGQIPLAADSQGSLHLGLGGQKESILPGVQVGMYHLFFS